MAKVRHRTDPFGAALKDHMTGSFAQVMVERDDGYVDSSLNIASYFDTVRKWPAHQRTALRYTRGRVLDIGCGAGRHGLYLQHRGHDVVGIDSSPGAVAVCRERGLEKARVLNITGLGRFLGGFDTILMMGNNFGLFAGPRRAAWLLKKMAGMTGAEARIIVETLDPHDSPGEVHRRYQSANKKKGRLPGQARIRLRYQDHATAWFDYLLVSPREMQEIVAGTGWEVTRTIPSSGPQYSAVLEKSA
jgi:SAM-dependent methyltransferase